MIAYPQLATGASTHYPAWKRHRRRTIVNESIDGRTVKFPDSGAASVEWQLSYAELSDDERGVLEDFHRSTEGSLFSFTFLDPLGNLLEWSEKLDEDAWAKEPQIAVSNGHPDPFGTERGWEVRNSGGASQSILQRLAAPADYVYCLSLYAQSDAPGVITLVRGADRLECATDSAWRRLVFAGQSAAGAEAVDFGFAVGPGDAACIYGVQVECQAGASAYQPTSAQGGVYSNARFKDDHLRFTATGVNRHSCFVNIIHANHL